MALTAVAHTAVALTAVAASAPPAVDRPGGGVAAVVDAADGVVDEVDTAPVPAGSAADATAVVAASVEPAGPMELAGNAGRAVANVDGWTSVVTSVLTTADFPGEHPLTNNSTAPAATKSRRVRPAGRHRVQQLIDDI